VAYHEIAMPHACTSGVRKNTIYILKSKTPIPWGEKSVKMVIFMALERSLLEDFRYLYCLLLRFLNHPKSFAGFVAAESFSMLMEQLSNFPADY
jgi:mannitol/fructose-specific phosphotransferase system IIA component (Ntr-type)